MAKKNILCGFLTGIVILSLANSVFAKDTLKTNIDNEFSKNNYQSIFYVNDIHGQLPNMLKITNAGAQFDAYVSQHKNIDAFKLSSGDIFIGSNDDSAKATVLFFNLNEISATVLGNHEFDMGATKLSKILPSVKAVKVGANAKYPPKNPLKNQIVKSIIVTCPSGEKYGILGAQSPTLIERMKDPTLFEGITISRGKQAYKELQAVVDNLTAQGVNKIIMLSHSGYEEEKEYAKNISHVDVILGGHSHDLIKDIKAGQNLQYSPAGEPVIITQAGRDGKNFGILNVEYDKNGVIVKAQNNVFTTSDFNKNLLMTTASDIVLGVSPVVCKVKSTQPLSDRMNVEENPYIDYFSDVARKAMGVDIFLMNSANFRGTLDVGNVTARDIEGIFPFKNKMVVVELSEKNFIEALNHGGTSLLAPDLKPSIIQGSGFTYKLSPKGKVVSATCTKLNGEKIVLNVDNPSDTKMLKVAYDDYLLAGGDAYNSLKDAKVLKKYPYDKDQIIIRYFVDNKICPEIEFKKDGRIQVEK
jgi:5'-nucleotidase